MKAETTVVGVTDASLEAAITQANEAILKAATEAHRMTWVLHLQGLLHEKRLRMTQRRLPSVYVTDIDLERLAREGAR